MLTSICPSLGLPVHDLCTSLCQPLILVQRLHWGAGGPGLDMWLHEGTICWPAKWPAWPGERPALSRSWQQSHARFRLIWLGGGSVSWCQMRRNSLVLNTAEGGIARSDVEGLEGGKRGDESHSSTLMHLQRGLRNGSTFRWYQNGKKSDVPGCLECHCPHLLWSCPRLPLSPGSSLGLPT